MTNCNSLISKFSSFVESNHGLCSIINKDFVSFKNYNKETGTKEDPQ